MRHHQTQLTTDTTTTASTGEPARRFSVRRLGGLLFAATLVALVLPLLGLGASPAQANPPPDLVVTVGDVTGHGYSATVYNVGGSDSGAFRVAVIAGAQTKSFYVANLKAGSMKILSLQYLHCHQLVAVWADPEHLTGDPHRGNNSAAGQAPCSIDGSGSPGWHGNGVSEG